MERKSKYSSSRGSHVEAREVRVVRWFWAGAAALIGAAFDTLAAPITEAARPLAKEAAIDSDTLRLAECPPDTAPDNGACIHLVRGAEDGPLAPALINA